MSVMSFTGKTLSPHLMFHNAASNIICQVLFGTRYEYDDHFIREIVRCFTENAKISNGPWAMVSQRRFKFLLFINYHCFYNFFKMSCKHLCILVQRKTFFLLLL